MVSHRYERVNASYCHETPELVQRKLWAIISKVTPCSLGPQATVETKLIQKLSFAFRILINRILINKQTVTILVSFIGIHSKLLGQP